MKKRVLILVPVALLLVVAYVCYVNKAKDNKSDRLAQNVESLSLPPEDYPKDFYEKYETLDPYIIIVRDSNGNERDSLCYFIHRRDCNGVGYLKCEETFDFHSKDSPQICPWD